MVMRQWEGIMPDTKTASIPRGENSVAKPLERGT